MSEREKLKPEENVKIVMKYIAGEVSISRTASLAALVASAAFCKAPAKPAPIFFLSTST